MTEFERWKVLLYQYTLFKSDYYKELANQATRKLQSAKCLSLSEYEKIYRDLLSNEIFAIIADDIYKLFK